MRETWALRRIVRRVAAEFAHVHSSKAGLAGRLAVRGGVPTMFTPHAWLLPLRRSVPRRAARSWERTAVRWTTLMVCVSEAERQRGVDASVVCEAVVLPNSVDLTRFAPAAPSQRTAAGAASFGVGDAPGCIGRLADQKGQDVLLGVLAEVRRQVPQAQLLIAGDGPEREHLEAAATEGVELLGTLEDVRGLYALRRRRHAVTLGGPLVRRARGPGERLQHRRGTGRRRHA